MADSAVEVILAVWLGFLGLFLLTLFSTRSSRDGSTALMSAPELMRKTKTEMESGGRLCGMKDDEEDECGLGDAAG